MERTHQQAEDSSSLNLPVENSGGDSCTQYKEKTPEKKRTYAVSIDMPGSPMTTPPRMIVTDPVQLPSARAPTMHFIGEEYAEMAPKMPRAVDFDDDQDLENLGDFFEHPLTPENSAPMWRPTTTRKPPKLARKAVPLAFLPEKHTVEARNMPPWSLYHNNLTNDNVNLARSPVTQNLSLLRMLKDISFPGNDFEDDCDSRKPEEEGNTARLCSLPRAALAPKPTGLYLNM